MVMALYGLAVFNLHYWGFGVPFILAGAWLLVRAYRLQRDLQRGQRATDRRPAPGRDGAGPSTDGSDVPGPTSATRRRPRRPSAVRPKAQSQKRAESSQPGT